MEYFLSILFLWAVITVLGHASWRVTQRLWRFLTGAADIAVRKDVELNSSDTVQQQRPSPVSDMMAFERMVDALHASDAITPKMANELKRRARVFAGLKRVRTTPPQARESAKTVALLNEDFAVDAKPPVRDELLAIVKSAAEPKPISVDARSVPAEPRRPPATPQRALSEVIASFLAAHNIRWGELVAGLLIVVCSIGLVVSLWSTLTSTHRVVPSLIFMSGDAAIFAAGLYTMRRWKLRHTSRAVLIIATLLVPLCVLAGLAAAGASVDSVSLFSPLTLATIVISTIGCGWLLWQASLALVGRGSAALLTASVVAPTLCLPILPTAARVLGLYAGSFLFLPAAVSAISLLIPARRLGGVRGGDEVTPMRVGRQFWKNHWLRLGIAASSLVSIIAYAAFLYRSDGRVAWVQIATATVPFWVAVGVMHASYLKRIWEEKKWVIERFIGSVLVVFAIGCVLAILPASIERLSWLWMHAAAVSISLFLAALLLDGKWKLLTASLPLGLASMLSSPAWMAGMDWSDVPLQRTLLSGEALIVAIGLAILSAVTWWVRSATSDKPQRSIDTLNSQPADLVPVFWAVIAGGQAVVLSVAPTSWLGILPVAGLASILAALTVILATIAMQYSKMVWLSALAGVSFWITSLGLVQWTDKGLSMVDHSIAPAMLGLSVSMLVLAIVFKIAWSLRKPTTWASAPPSISRLTGISVASACGVLGTLVMLAVIGQTQERTTASTWGTSTWLIAAASIVLTAASIVVNHRRYMQLGMMASAMAAFCGVTYFAGIELWQQPFWSDSSALWSLAGIFVVVAAGWFGLREVVRWKQPKLLPLVATRPMMPDGWLALAAVGLISIAIAWQYFAVLSGPLGKGPLETPFQTGLGLSLSSLRSTALRYAVLMGATGCVGLWCVRESSKWIPRVLGVMIAFGGLFLAIVISCRLIESPSLRLVATTTLTSAGIVVAWFVTSWKSHVRKNSVDQSQLDRLVGVSAIALLVSLGSTVLLWSNWWLPISEGMIPDRWSTFAVATWWAMASLGLLFGRMLRRASETGVESVGMDSDGTASVLSAMLLPMAVLICIPVMFAVLPVVWWQASLLGSVVWLLLARGQARSPRSKVPAAGRPSPVLDFYSWATTHDAGEVFSSVWIGVVGVTSAGVALWFVLHSQHSVATVAWTLPLGVFTSLLAFCVYCRDSRWAANGSAPREPTVSNALPFLPVLMSGHIAVIAETMGWVDSPNTRLLVMGCGLIGCMGSAILVWRTSPVLHVWHVVVQAVALTCFAVFDWWNIFQVTGRYASWPEWIAMAGLTTGAVALLRFASPREWRKNAFSHVAVEMLPRLFGWFVAVAGGWVLHVHPLISWHSPLMANTCLIGWIGACVVLWRSDRLTDRGNQQPTRADVGVSSLLLPTLALSFLDLVNWPGFTRGYSAVPLMMFWLQGMIAVAVACSAWLRPALVPARPVSMWTITMALFSSAGALAAAALSRLFGFSWEVLVVVAITAAAVTSSVIVTALPWSERLRARLAVGLGAEPAANSSVDRLSIAIEQVILCLAWIGAFVSFGLFVTGSETNLIRTKVCWRLVLSRGLCFSCQSKLCRWVRRQRSAGVGTAWR